MQGHFSEDTVAWLYANYPEVMESNLYDYTSCQRPNGTVYGTAGTCRKGTEIQQRREESVKHLNNSIATLKQKREQLPSDGRERIDRLISKLEGDLKAIQGEGEPVRKKTGVAKTSSRKPVSKPVDKSHMKPEKSRNEMYGFHGTTRDSHPKDTEERWQQAARAVQSQGLDPTLARRMLDSSWGRHLADSIESVPTAKVEQEVRRKFETQTPLERSGFRKMWKTLLTEED